MSTTTLTSPATEAATAPAGNARPGEVDNRIAYIGFTFAYVIGHGAAALSAGPAPLIDLPGWLPLTLLVAGLAVGITAATVAATRAQRGAAKPEILSGKLLGAAWMIGFTALFLAITGLSTTLAMPELQSLLWPTGSGLVVGLVYLAEGAVRRNVLHYTLGAWLALASTAALLLPTPGPYWVLALAGGGAYVLATVLERRRIAVRP